ncbi:MAG: FAD:protein FMN transferase [Clostridia bacterium]|nr:FAD:protein FMN transferase [Clostridia bacterium]
MKKRFLQLTCALLSAVFLTAFVACGENIDLPRFPVYNYFNTSTDWKYISQSEEIEKSTWKQISKMLNHVEESISVSVEKSSVSKFNAADAGAKVQIDETAYTLFALAQELYEKTDGAYNPAVGNLVDLWAFSPRFDYLTYEAKFPYDRVNPYKELPSVEYVEAFKTLSDFSQVQLLEEEGKYYAVKPDCKVEKDGYTYTMQLNLGGIGKGYAVDEADRIIRAAGYEYGYFNLGGSSMSVLKNPSETAENNIWSIGVVNPRGTDLCEYSSFMAVKEKDIFLSSSGDYEQSYTYDGKRYSHIINPYTGYPVNAAPTDAEGGIICASVFGLGSAAEGDATTTALVVMGKEKAISYIQENLMGVHALFVYDNGDGTYTLYTNMEESDYTLYAEMETVKL